MEVVDGLLSAVARRKAATAPLERLKKDDAVLAAPLGMDLHVLRRRKVPEEEADEIRIDGLLEGRISQPPLLDHLARFQKLLQSCVLHRPRVRVHDVQDEVLELQEVLYWKNQNSDGEWWWLGWVVGGG